MLGKLLEGVNKEMSRVWLGEMQRRVGWGEAGEGGGDVVGCRGGGGGGEQG